MTGLRALALIVVLLGCTAAAAETIVAGGDYDFPPYEFLDEDGEAAGLNIDLIRAIAEVSGFDVEFRLGPWEESRAAIAAGRIDLLAMYVGDFRNTEVDYATPHLILYHEIFIRQNETALNALADLAGRDVIVQRDAWVAEKLVAEGIAANLIEVETERDALRLLAAGEYDAALVSEIVGRRILASEGLDNITTSGAPLFPVEYALAVTEGNQALLARVEAGLAQLKSTGRFNAIHDRWLGLPRERPKVGLFLHWLLVIMPALLAAALLMLIWRQSRQGRRSGDAGDFEADFRRDQLTGLPNRVELEQAIEACLASADGGPRTRALLHIDLDQFKLVNQSRDYHSGDELIKQVARRMQRQCHARDVLARFGSDEFGLLLCPGRDPDEAAEALRRDLAEHEFDLDREAIHVTASIGLAILDEQTTAIGELLKQAEAACHVAKENGRNRVHRFHAEDEAVAERHGQMRWAREVGLALKEDRLELHYQTIEAPIPNHDDGLIIELLLRMRLPDGRLIAAGEFVPAAERYFMAHRIDRWVLRSALAWLERQPQLVKRLDRVFINLSTRSLGDDRFLPFALETLRTHEVPASKIGFEITETAVMTHLKTAMKTIEHLRGLGCQFALDDFGVGISSMAYLKNLPVDVLKIDGSFTGPALEGERERAMLAEINDLGHVLGKTTVIEHVESDAARALVAELKIDLAQGFGISRPRPLSDLLD
ncbi:putative bifunctional diguanylate cyclase/phosphodiesterase [Wenzhouxiangella marina]|uniref:PAS sensor diguanylate cyclase and phosphodiesterase n=1 Tax=Wenzhouxiangella marina TaxID=1579979 RepID=A0A0K0XZG6_9GAMM|nr:EAL domain-containing protein [Wenzhouxiangella marina]AKS43079.1 PAS sensor diguanylate cyclase and phosphodiesterase [Wenzhouxiangella marina]MBB6087237.1 diguanylate cyclase (GGDEF)-like protein [Wenzhouxiangella marina]